MHKCVDLIGITGYGFQLYKERRSATLPLFSENDVFLCTRTMSVPLHLLHISSLMHMPVHACTIYRCTCVYPMYCVSLLSLETVILTRELNTTWYQRCPDRHGNFGISLLPPEEFDFINPDGWPRWIKCFECYIGFSIIQTLIIRIWTLGRCHVFGSSWKKTF